LLARRQVAVREEERKRLSMDLHDDVCQELVAVGILVESAVGRLGPVPPEATSELTRAGRYLGEVVDHLRVLARDLRPLVLNDLGLESGLRSLALGLSSADTMVRAEFPTEIPRLAESAEISIHRIAQEAVTNAVRHAQARNVTMTLTAFGGRLRLEVRDDGRGLDLRAPAMTHALGLASMEERAQALGGRLTVESRHGAGTIIRLDCPLPLRADASAA
jgi:two-component system sensor histidine kinase UhpB